MATKHTKSGGPAIAGTFQRAVSFIKKISPTAPTKTSTQPASSGTDSTQPASSGIDRPDSPPHPELTGTKHPELTGTKHSELTGTQHPGLTGPIHRASRSEAACVAPTTEGESAVLSPTIKSTELHLMLAQPFASLEGKEDACKMGLALDISRALGPGFKLVKVKITSLQRGASSPALIGSAARLGAL